MKKRILLLSLCVTLTGLLLYALFSTLTFHENLIETNKQTLSVYMLGYEYNRQRFSARDDAAARMLSIECGGARVTFIAPDGTVTGDSGAQELENHLDRDEVIAAKRSGEGYAVRRSDTIGKESLYYCKRYDDGFVRLSILSASVWSVLLGQLPLLGVFLLLDVGLCVGASFLFVRLILRPVERFGAKAGEAGRVEAPYPELEGLAGILDDMKRDVAAQVEALNDEKRRETVILDNMPGGMAIFRDGEATLINKAAAQILGYGEKEGVPARLVSDGRLRELVESGEGTLRREIGSAVYEFRAMPVPEMKACVLLIADVTAEVSAERMKNEFISNVTHEMNTPLTAISGFAELMAAGKLKKEKLPTAAKVIFEESGRLSGLVKSILNYSAIEAGGESYPVDVAAIASDVVERERGAAEAKGVTLICQTAMRATTLSRTERIRELIENLVTNAVKYNVPGGKVTVKVEGGEKPVLRVTDTGIGIERDKLERIFDRFYTVDTSRSSGGYGLGLAIVKKLAKVEGWTVTVESQVGAGSTFTVAFSR